MRKTPDQWYQIKAVGSKVEVRIFGEIGWEVVASEFISELDALGKDTELDVRINSVGGSVFEGLHIYNRLRMHEGTVNITIESLAASMASVIAMAGDHVAMMTGSLMMIHNPATAAWGDQSDLEKAAETLAKIKETLLDAYQSRSNKSRDELAQMMDEETWMTAAEAIESGFVNEVIEPDEDLDIAACLRAADLSWFKRQPTALKTREPIQNTFILLPDPESPDSSQPAASAANNGGSNMTPEEIAAAEAAAREEGRKAELQRRTDITSVFNGFEGYEALQASCLEDAECDAETARSRLLDAVKAKNEEITPTGGVIIAKDQVDKRREAAVAWIGQRASFKNPDGTRVVAAGDNPFRGMTFLDMAKEFCAAANIDVRSKLPMEIVAAAITHSTSDFPNALQDAMHKSMIDAFNLAADTWRVFCRTGDLADFRPHYRHIAGSFSDLLPLGENGELQDGTLDDTRKETITADTKGRILNLSHQMIVNDDMSVFSGASTQMGRSAARAVENDVYALLALNSGLGPVMSDGNTLFHTDHGNTGTGAPSVQAFDDAINQIAQQKLPNAESEADEYIDLASPPVFVGPLSLRGDARVINESQYDPDANNKLQKPNKSRGLLGPIVGTPRLTGTPWYLFPDPAEVPVIEVGFVQGQQEPQLVMEEAFRQYGVGWRVVYNYGVAAVNWLGTHRSTGA